MTRDQTVLVQLLSHCDESVKSAIKTLSEIELSELFFHASVLVTAMQFLKEEHWLQFGKDTNQEFFKEFVSEIFKSELVPIHFLQDFLESSSIEQSKDIGKKAVAVETLALETIKSRDTGMRKVFARHALQRMSRLFEYEIEMKLQKKIQGRHLGISFYRTFDRLDELFDLNYDADKGMMAPLENSQRLYSGAGVGVQSGYSTILTALHHLHLQNGDRVIDLGSGYGRVGLVTGLLHKDVDFIGYEFVPHRVDIASAASRALSLQEHVSFHTCDLSGAFQIPDAEVYYLYDPFTTDTYRHVLNQLAAISRRQKITIVTKGNARSPLVELVQRENWPVHREFDDGNLCLFCSRPSQDTKP